MLHAGHRERGCRMMNASFCSQADLSASVGDEGSGYQDPDLAS